MNFWQFLDKQLNRIHVSAVGIAGAGIFVLTGVVLYMLDNDRELADNDLFKTLAQAIIVQGLIGLAMASWFTTNANRKVQDTRIVNKKNEAVPVEDEGKLEDAG